MSRLRALPSLLLAVLLAACGASERALPPVYGAPEDATLWQIPDRSLDEAVDALPEIAQRAMEATGVPGLAIAVVQDDRLLFAGGFGVRRLGGDDAVDAETPFPIADLSVPLSATITARAVEQGGVRWTDPVRTYLPTFELGEPTASSLVTLEDLYAHRSGLPVRAGVLFRDLGYDRAATISMLRGYQLAPLRTTYGYTDVGIAVAEETVAAAKNATWAELARQLLLVPAGMTRTSLEDGSAPAESFDVAAPHRRVGEVWEVAGPEAAMSGPISTVTDLAQWMRLIMSAGRVGERAILAPESVQNLLTPRMTTNAPTSTAGRAAQYGLGIGIGVDESGRVRLTHSGGSARGVSGSLAMVPAERFGIVVLTNGEPTGAAEAIVAEFLERVEAGGARRPWLEVYRAYVNASREHPRALPATPPVGSQPMPPAVALVGRYHNDLYGMAEVVERGDRLILRLGPRPAELELDPYDGSILAVMTEGDAAEGRQAVAFTVPPGGRASSFSMTYLEVSPGAGTFVRLD